MEASIKDIGKIPKEMDLEFVLLKMDLYMMECGKKTEEKVKGE